MTKIYIATPAYSGLVHVPYTLSMVQTGILLQNSNIDYQIQITTGGSLLVKERNYLIRQFLESNATHMLCIDADLGWEPKAVIDFLDYDEEFVAGLYPIRDKYTFIFRPLYNEDGAIVKSDKNLIGMEYVPSGFMLLKRSVIEKMIKKFPELYFEYDDPQFPSGYCLFNTEVWNGTFWGEDFVFCRRAREAGVKIWVDPVVEFNHAGIKCTLLQALRDSHVSI